MVEYPVEVMEGEMCPFCHKRAMTLRETQRDIPFFGPTYLFSMDCTACNYHKADVEIESVSKPVTYTFTCESEDDLKVRVVKSSTATIKIGRIGSIESGPATNGYVTNIEGLLQRLKHQIELIRDNSDDNDDRKKAKSHLKKLNRILWGQESVKIVIEDSAGNSAIISEKALKK